MRESQKTNGEGGGGYFRFPTGQKITPSMLRATPRPRFVHLVAKTLLKKELGRAVKSSPAMKKVFETTAAVENKAAASAGSLLYKAGRIALNDLKTLKGRYDAALAEERAKDAQAAPKVAGGNAAGEKRKP